MPGQVYANRLYLLTGSQVKRTAQLAYLAGILVHLFRTLREHLPALPSR